MCDSHHKMHSDCKPASKSSTDDLRIWISLRRSYGRSYLRTHIWTHPADLCSIISSFAIILSNPTTYFNSRTNDASSDDLFAIFQTNCELRTNLDTNNSMVRNWHVYYDWTFYGCSFEFIWYVLLSRFRCFWDSCWQKRICWHRLHGWRWWNSATQFSNQNIECRLRSLVYQRTLTILIR